LNGLIVFVFLQLAIACSNNNNLNPAIPPPSFDYALTSEENIDSYIDQLIKNESGPGISIAVVKDNAVVVRKSYGLANIEDQIAISSDTPFYLASVSKQFTAMAVMILGEKGLLTYDEKLSTYLPDTPNEWKKITVHYLLTHQSGIPNYANLPGFSIEQVTNTDVLEKLIENRVLNFTPGERFSYSNSGYIALSHIIESVSGQSLGSFLKEEIFDPLEMTNSIVYDESTPDINNKVIGYKSNADGSYSLRDYNQLTTGPGGIYSMI